MNARTAPPNDACAGVNAGAVPHRDRGAEGSFHFGWPGLLNSHAAGTMKSTAAAASRAVRLLAGTTETTNVVNEVPRIGVGDLALKALHFVLRRRAVLDSQQHLPLT